MFFKIGAPKTFTFTGKPALRPLFNKITPKQVLSVNIAKFLRLVFCIDEFSVSMSFRKLKKIIKKNVKKYCTNLNKNQVENCPTLPR